MALNLATTCTTCMFGYESIVLSFLFGGYFGHKKQLAHCDVYASQLVRLLYDSELVSVNHQNCLKHTCNKSFLSNEKKFEAHLAYLIFTIIYVN